MDLGYNDKLKDIMKRHDTDKWNEDCERDPAYLKARAEKYGEVYDRGSYERANAAFEAERKRELDERSYEAWKRKDLPRKPKRKYPTNYTKPKKKKKR